MCWVCSNTTMHQSTTKWNAHVFSSSTCVCCCLVYACMHVFNNNNIVCLPSTCTSYNDEIRAYVHSIHEKKNYVYVAFWVNWVKCDVRRRRIHFDYNNKLGTMTQCLLLFFFFFLIMNLTNVCAFMYVHSRSNALCKLYGVDKILMDARIINENASTQSIYNDCKLY